MPVTPDTVSHLQAAGHDAIHASSVGLAQATDPEIIEIARRDGRVVVTADLDYPRLVLLVEDRAWVADVLGLNHLSTSGETGAEAVERTGEVIGRVPRSGAEGRAVGVLGLARVRDRRGAQATVASGAGASC